MISEFRSRPQYTRYTCRPWPWIWSKPSPADVEARQAQARPYDLGNDNCLVRSVAAFEQYGIGMPPILHALLPFDFPNAYFLRLLEEHKTEGGPPTK